MKKTLEEKDTSLAKARAEADAMTKKADDRLEELQEAREMNDNYLKAVEDMKKQIEALKASESEWHTKYVKRFDLAEMTKMKYEKDIGELKKGMSDTETFLVGQLDEVKQRLEGRHLLSSRVEFAILNPWTNLSFSDYFVSLLCSVLFRSAHGGS